MAKSNTIAEQLEVLAQGAGSMEPAQMHEILRKGLASKTATIVIQAANLIGKLKVTQLAEDLSNAYERYSGEGMRLDKNCRIKCAVVKSLHEIRSTRTEIFRQGMECYWPSKPPRNLRDDATELRIASAYAYAELGQSMEVEELACLLADPVDDVRFAAVRSIASIGGIHCYLLLKLKALIGDSIIGVTEACFEGLMERDKPKAIPFIGEFLRSEDDQVRASAALVLGHSRLPQAFDLLVSAWRVNVDLEAKKDILIAIATLRLDIAQEFLLGLVQQHHLTAGDAIHALKFCSIPDTREKLARIVDQIGEADLQKAFDETFS